MKDDLNKKLSDAMRKMGSSGAVNSGKARELAAMLSDSDKKKLLEEFDKIDEKKLNNILNDEKFGKLKQMSAADLVKLFRKGSK